MAEKQTFNVDGKEVEGVEVSFEPVKEPWGEYDLTDGGHFRLRHTALRVFQILDEDGKWAKAPDGQRQLAIVGRNEVVVQS